ASATITSTPGTPTPGLPDLVPVTIGITAPTPIGGCGPAPPITMSIVVKNQGSADAGEFDVTVNNQFFGRAGPLAANAQLSVDGPLQSGDLSVRVDSGDEVVESDENNNLDAFFVPFFTPPPSCTITGTPTATATEGGVATATASASATSTETVA